MFGYGELYSNLNVSAITATLDARSKKDPTPALIGDVKIPSDWTARKVVNFYLVSPFRPEECLQPYVYQANCRSDRLYDCYVIVNAILAQIHRRYDSANKSFFDCQVKAPIPPQDMTDQINVPIEITVKIKTM